MRALINILSTAVGLLVGWVVSTMATGDTYPESDGKAVTVTLNYTVEKMDVVVVSSRLGIACADGDSGDEIALDISPVERQFTVPAALGLSNGDICYIEVADLTGHKPDDDAYGTTAGAGKVAFFKATCDQSSTWVTGIVLAAGSLAS